MTNIEENMTSLSVLNVAQPSYRVLARKYRPQNFTDLIGQDSMVKTLTNAFDIGRIAQAWMLTGVRGVGKTTTARILARALNFKTANIDKPTIELNAIGEHCQAIMEGRHVDVIEMDAASHTGIDDIREIIEQVRYRPVSARYKIYIIDEVHMLSQQAFNGLLKTLEEPPPHVKFIFATTEIRKVPITVLSRCQRFDLRRIESHVLTNHLKKICTFENVEAEDKALSMIARAGEGSVRDALSILDQAIAHGDSKIEAEPVRTMLGLADRARIIDLFEFIMQGHVESALNELRSQYNIGADPLVILQELADFNHMVTRLRFTPNIAEDVTISEDERLRGLDFSQKLSVRILSRNWQMLLKAMPEVEQAPSPIQAAEMLIIRLTHAADLPTLDETLKAIAQNKGAQNKGAENKGAENKGNDTLSVQSRTIQPSSSISAKKNNISNQNAANLDNPRVHEAAEEIAETRNAPKVHETAPKDAVSQNNVHFTPIAQNEPITQNTPITQNNTALSLSINENQHAIHNVDNKIHTLQDIIALAQSHNDIHFKLLVKEFFRPVHFNKNHIELEIAENAPASFAQDLAKKLREWTGERFTISVVNQGGGKTLREEEDIFQQNLVTDAENDPEIASILKYFSNAKIVDVRLEKQDDEQPYDGKQDDILDLSNETYLIDGFEDDNYDD